MLKRTHVPTRTVICTCALSHTARCRQGRGRDKRFREYVDSFPTRLLKPFYEMSSSAQAELCAWFSMMRCPQWTDTTLCLTATPYYSMSTTSLLRNPLLRLSPPSDWMDQEEGWLEQTEPRENLHTNAAYNWKKTFWYCFTHDNYMSHYFWVVKNIVFFS